MLEKNKDYIEFSMHTMMLTHKPYQEDTNIAITGMISGRENLTEPNPFDIPCEVVMVPKKEFERLQAAVDINAEIAKEWEKNYDLLLKRTGFDTAEELVNYLDSEAECDTLREAIASLGYSVKFARDERRSLSKKLDECEKDYISERDKAEALEKENEQLKQKLHEFDPMPDYKELLKELYSTEDVEKLEWTLNHICGGRGSANGWMATARFWRQNYETLSKLVGFSSVEEIQDYLTNGVEANTLYEAISKLHDQVKYTCDEWYSANSSNNSWKAAAECNSPKELMEKIDGFETEIIDLKTKNTEYACKIQDLIMDSCGRKTVIEAYKRDIERWQEATCCSTSEEAKELIGNKNGGIVELKNKLDASLTANEQLKKEIGIYSRALNEWKEGTGCPSPSAAKTLIESGASWMTAYRSSCEVIKTWKKLTGCPTPIAAKTLIESGMSYEHGFHEVQEENRKLIDDINSWKNVTGYSIPEEFLSAMINNKPQSLYSWQKATGCKTPEEAKSAIRYYKARLGNAVQSASIATKILGNAVQSEANAMEILDTIGYKDPIKED